jgi:hypothetical protein
MDGCRVRETYELTAAVFHVRDAKTAGNIVAVVKVQYSSPSHELTAVMVQLYICPLVCRSTFQLDVVLA